MIKIIWNGYIQDKQLIEIKKGQILKIQTRGTGSCIVKGILSFGSDLEDIPIGFIRASDLKVRNRVITNNIYQADVSGYEYITVEINGFDFVYGVIIGDKDEVIHTHNQADKIESVIIVDNDYNETIKLVPYVQRIESMIDD